MQKITLALVALLLAVGLGWQIAAGAQPVSAAAAFEEETPPPPTDGELIKQALLQAVQAHSEAVLAFAVNPIEIDNIIFTPDGDTAVVWLAMRDPMTGEIIATEPGLAIAERDASSPNGWSITLQADNNWNDKLSGLPSSLLTDEQRTTFSAPPESRMSAQAGTVYRGYYLPWAAGLSKKLSGSIGHFLIYNSCSEASCRYAYDFADGTMFPLLASKAGKTKYAAWSCDNGRTDCNNYLVIEDTSTSPTTYQLYLHMAKDSIPVALRTPGATIRQGQFIGNVDDTGYSTGHHLHFMVHTNPYSYWGNSVDIIFEDVTVNGGRPRTCYEASRFSGYGTGCMPNDSYVSKNSGDPVLPTGALTAPFDRDVVSTSKMLVGGWGKDNLALDRMQVMVNYDGSWKALGEPFKSSPFAGYVDLCSAGVPSGPMTIALQVWDAAGNYTDMLTPRQVISQITCPAAIPPECMPSDDEVTLFADGYFKGDCKKAGVGGYATIEQHVGPNNAESALVGANVRVILFDQVNFQGRSETLWFSDNNFADNRLKNGKPDSFIVQKKTTALTTPILFPPNPVAGQPITTDDSLILTWDNQDGGYEYSSTLTGPNNFTAALSWQRTNQWAIGSLATPGTYTWKVSARYNGDSKSTSMTFTVVAATASTSTAPALGVPYVQDFEGADDGWTSSGLWRKDQITRGAVTSHAWVYNRSDTLTYADPLVRSGSLTSPAIQLSEGVNYLTFSSFTNTEPYNSIWDMRRVQISVSGGPFKNLYTLANDRRGMWVNSANISLSAYSGKTVRIRFLFDTLDSNYNTYDGWVVDNVRIGPLGLPACSESASNNAYTTPTALTLGVAVAERICQAGDVDYYAFSAEGGQRIFVDLITAGQNSKLAPALYLLDRDGSTVLAMAESATPKDLHLEYTTWNANKYYVLVKSYAHPGQGDLDQTYTLKVWQDQPPSAVFVKPSGTVVPGYWSFPVEVKAADAEGSVASVELLYHSSNWGSDSNWISLGVDSNGSDGYVWTVDPVALNLQKGAALYARTVDERGFVGGTPLWNLNPDRTPPDTRLSALSSPRPTTHFQVAWTLTSGSDLDHYEFYAREAGSSNWQSVDEAIPAGTLKAWFWAEPGKTYEFCVQGVDWIGNHEACPATPELTVIVEDVCAADAYEDGDDSPAGATLLGATAYQHNICGLGDVDWYRFSAAAGRSYYINIRPINTGTNISLALYGPNDPTRLVTSFNPSAANVRGNIHFEAVADGVYYLKAVGYDARLTGTITHYTISVNGLRQLFLPLFSVNRLSAP